MRKPRHSIVGHHEANILGRFEPPTVEESRRFLISFLFGGSMEPGLKECVRRGYLDLSRTAHGIGKLPASKDLKGSAYTLVESLLKEATKHGTAWTMAAYDEWHKSKCAAICQFYGNNNFSSFRVGQAQKWLNMSVKYALALHSVGMLAISQGQSLRTVAHIPLDDFMVTALRPLGAPNVGSAWSRIESYDTYFEYQEWFRKHFKESVPLDAEFHLWIEEARRRRGA